MPASLLAGRLVNVRCPKIDERRTKPGGSPRGEAVGRPRRRLDTSRAANEFGLKAKTIFKDGLEKAIEWYEGKA